MHKLISYTRSACAENNIKYFLFVTLLQCIKNDHDDSWLVIFYSKEYYDRRYDYYDVDQLIQNPRLLRKYLNCFLDKGPCPPIGRLFKALLPEVVMTSCAKCSPRQKRLARRAIDAFDRYLPQQHQELRTKLDPQNKYYDNFLKAIRA